MAWRNVELTYGKTTYAAMQRGAEVAAPASIGSPKTVKVDGQSHGVLAAEKDSRGEYVYLWLDCKTNETAEAETVEEMSDDEPDERGSDD
jgi:hypothetical protein